MKEGYFVGRNGKAVLIRDHEQDLRSNPSLLKPLGVSAALVKRANDTYPDNRESFLTEILKGVIRIRGQGSYTTAEWWSGDDSIPEGLAVFVQDHLCEGSLLKIVNLKDNEVRWMRGEELLKSAVQKKGGFTASRNLRKLDGKRGPEKRL